MSAISTITGITGVTCAESHRTAPQNTTKSKYTRKTSQAVRARQNLSSPKKHPENIHHKTTLLVPHAFLGPLSQIFAGQAPGEARRAQHDHVERHRAVRSTRRSSDGRWADGCGGPRRFRTTGAEGWWTWKNVCFLGLSYCEQQIAAVDD